MDVSRPIGTYAFAVSSLLIATVALGAAPSAEPPITVAGVEGDYLRSVHSRFHERWTKKVAPTNDLSAPTVVVFSIRWDGTIAQVNLATSSGSPQIDRDAVDLVRAAGRFPVPPVDLFSDDGLAHFRWGLARDHRLCSDGRLVRKEDPLDEALPRLFIQGRVKEALLRVTRQLKAGTGGDVLALFAKAWLLRLNPDPVVDAEAAALLARLGDVRQIDRLRGALARRDTVATAAAAMRILKVDICPMVQERLLGGDPEAQEVATLALRHGAAPMSEPGACDQALAAIAVDGKLPGRLRALALETAAALSPPADNAAARRLLTGALTDSDPLVRAVAVLASARPGGGKAVLYRLTPLLRDRAVEVRAAAAAGLVRAGGDQFLDQLAPALKEPDGRIAIAVAGQLALLGSERSAALLGTLLNRAGAPHRAAATDDVREAVIRALAAHQDPGAGALLAPILAAARKDPRAPAAARELALASAEPEELLPLVGDPELATMAFRSLLRAKRHREAADLLIAQFDRLAPSQMVLVLGAWLENPPSPSTAMSSRDAGQ